MPTLPEGFSSDAQFTVTRMLQLKPEDRSSATQLLATPWMENVRAQDVSVTRSPAVPQLAADAARTVLAEVADALVGHVALAQQRSDGTPTLVDVEAKLVHNIAAQLGVSEYQVRVALQSSLGSVAPTRTTSQSLTDTGRFSKGATASSAGESMDVRNVERGEGENEEEDGDVSGVHADALAPE